VCYGWVPLGARLKSADRAVMGRALRSRQRALALGEGILGNVRGVSARVAVDVLVSVWCEAGRCLFTRPGCVERTGRRLQSTAATVPGDADPGETMSSLYPSPAAQVTVDSS
jgi:hypothetical protein